MTTGSVASRAAAATLASGTEPSTMADVAERVSPAVVSLTATRSPARGPGAEGGAPLDNPLFRHFFGPGGGPFGPDPGPGPALPRGRGPAQRGVGSGVLVSADGFILTNNHIIEGADEVRVELADGRELVARVVGIDPPSDLALLDVEATGLPFLPLGDSSRLRVGEIVLAVGNPFGLGLTVTMGIVSATGRTEMGITEYDDFIQTDASINPGNSGGALVNLAGQLVGINTAILSRTGGNQGVGFAIPSNMASVVMTALREHGRVVRGYLGIGIQELTPVLARSLGLPEGATGVLVSEVMPDSPAARAGLRPGDLVVSVAGRAVAAPAQLRSAVAGLGPEARARLRVLRAGAELELDVLLGEAPGQAASAAPRGAPAGQDSGLEGVSVVAASPDQLASAGAEPGESAVLVTDVAPTSAAARAGLRAGDLVLELNRNRVTSPLDFRTAASNAAGSGVVVRVLREGRRIYLAWT